LPCVNYSRDATRIIGKTIYLGFVHVQYLEKVTIELIVSERNCHGKYQTLIDFVERVPVAKEQLVILIRLGAFRFTGKEKSHLLWEAHLHLKKTTKEQSSPTVFRAESKEFQLPQLKHEPLEDAYDEIELLGFPVSSSRFDMLRTSFRGQVQAKGLMQSRKKEVKMVGDLVTIKYVRTVKKEVMHFGTFLDSSGEFFDTVHFPGILKKYPFKGPGVYLILGNVVEEFGFPSLEVKKMARLSYRPDPRE